MGEVGSMDGSYGMNESWNFKLNEVINCSQLPSTTY